MHIDCTQQLEFQNNLSLSSDSHLYTVSLNLSMQARTTTACSLPVLPARQLLLMRWCVQVIYGSTFVDSCWISWFFNFASLQCLSDPFRILPQDQLVLPALIAQLVERLCLWRDFHCRWFVRLRFSCVFGRLRRPLAVLRLCFALICSTRLCIGLSACLTAKTY